MSIQVDLQSQVPGFTFKGTGFYRNPSTFYIVISDGDNPTDWQVTWPPAQTFKLYAYNVTFGQTLFGTHPGMPPTR